jgi:BirA family biotin operon repressor/biotin-[acetyl-CoA-carboxylase] ligase
LAASTRFRDVRELAVVGSTNRYLLDLARAGASEGVVVVADYQSAGRGRLGRSWEAPPGAALLMSVLLRPDLAAERRWLVPAAVALAAADACSRGAEVEIKWPNDLLLGGRKLAGILAEADGTAIVVGIGINVTWAPPGAALLGPADRGSLLAALLTHLEGWYDRWAEAGAAYRARCATVGRRVRVEVPGHTVLGTAVGITPDGHLQVVAEDDDEVQTFAVAEVIHVTAA